GVALLDLPERIGPALHLDDPIELGAREARDVRVARLIKARLAPLPLPPERAVGGRVRRPILEVLQRHLVPGHLRLREVRRNRLGRVPQEPYLHVTKVALERAPEVLAVGAAHMLAEEGGARGLPVSPDRAEAAV